MADFSGELTKVVNEVVDKAKEVGEFTKLQALIKAEEAKKQDYYYRLGKKYYEIYKDAPASDLSEYMNKLIAADEKIEELKKQLQDNKEMKEAAKNAAAAADVVEDTVEDLKETAEEVVEEVKEQTEA